MSRFGGHDIIDSFVRAFKSVDNLAAALVCSMIPISTKRSLIHSRVNMLPDSVVVGVVTWLLSGGGEFQGRDRGRCALYCPFIEYPPLQPEVSRQLTRTSTSQPSKDAVGSKLPGGAKPASVNSGSPHQQADIPSSLPVLLGGPVGWVTLSTLVWMVPGGYVSGLLGH